jgi:hypothetical protein
MQMDLTNLQNEQQARVVNTQARVQSILEDAKAENTKRMFVAESTNDLNKYYDNLNTSIKTFNASQKNSMEQFNAGEANSLAQFNANLENNREQFYREMQYNIDVANTKWRQTVTLTNTEMQFQAAATDVKNMVDLSTEQLNQLWDRSDAILDYTWKSAETSLERENQLAIGKMNLEAANNQASATRSAGRSSATGQIIGTIAAAAIFSDSTLKTDISKIGVNQKTGLNLYQYRYKADPEKVYVGVMAEEVKEKYPSAIRVRKDGIMSVDYNKLGIELVRLQ